MGIQQIFVVLLFIALIILIYFVGSAISLWVQALVSGARVGPDFQVSGPGAVADDGYPAVAWNDNANRYLVVYEDDRGGHDRQMDIYGQFVAG